MEIEKVLAVVFVIAWFIFWGWMFATRPQTAFIFWDKSNQNMKAAAKGATKLGMFGLRIWRR